MSLQGQPFVSVLTPVFNGEAYLVDCIESILKQTYQNYEYIIVNNCSTDGTREIALRYAKQDPRIRVHDNETFVDVIANHNAAFRLMSPAAKYCKVVSADDFLFPECIARMVELAEANPSVGIVGSYQLSDDRVRWQGFKYPRAVVPGIEMGRKAILGRDRTFGFGSPTSNLYRADLVRSTRAFYPNPNPHSDTSACLKAMQESDFGFVYQVLSYERIHESTQSFASKKVNRFLPADVNDLVCYGPSFLNEDELARKLKEALGTYHRYLGLNYFFGFRDKAFWDYHKTKLDELGFPLKRRSLYKAVLTVAITEALNPGQAISRIWERWSAKKATGRVQAAQPGGQPSRLRNDGQGARAGRGV